MRQNERRLTAGPVWRDHGLVFCSEVGTPILGSNLWRQYKRSAEVDYAVRIEPIGGILWFTVAFRRGEERGSLNHPQRDRGFAGSAGYFYKTAVPLPLKTGVPSSPGYWIWLAA